MHFSVYTPSKFDIYFYEGLFLVDFDFLVILIFFKLKIIITTKIVFKLFFSLSLWSRTKKNPSNGKTYQ